MGLPRRSPVAARRRSRAKRAEHVKARRRRLLPARRAAKADGLRRRRLGPPDGKIPPVTAEAQRRAQAAGRVRSSFVGGPFDGPEDVGLLERCISRSVPGSMIPVMYGNNYQIVQTPGYVTIIYEIIHET